MSKHIIAYCACGSQLDYSGRGQRCRECYWASIRVPAVLRVTATPWRELPDGTQRRFVSSDAGLLAEVSANDQ